MRKKAFNHSGENMNNKLSKLTLATLLTASTMAFAVDFEMKPRPTDEKYFPEYIQYLVDVAEPRTAGERKADTEMKKRYNDALVLDSLFVGGPGFPTGFSAEQYEEAT